MYSNGTSTAARVLHSPDGTRTDATIKLILKKSTNHCNICQGFKPAKSTSAFSNHKALSLTDQPTAAKDKAELKTAGKSMAAKDKTGRKSMGVKDNVPSKSGTRDAFFSPSGQL
jgi:hypothetical protein